MRKPRPNTYNPAQVLHLINSDRSRHPPLSKLWPDGEVHRERCRSSVDVAGHRAKQLHKTCPKIRMASAQRGDRKETMKIAVDRRMVSRHFAPEPDAIVVTVRPL